MRGFVGLRGVGIVGLVAALAACRSGGGEGTDIGERAAAAQAGGGTVTVEKKADAGASPTPSPTIAAVDAEAAPSDAAVAVADAASSADVVASDVVASDVVSADERAAIEAAIAGKPRDAWYGIYVMNKKVGHGHMTARRTGNGEPGVYVVSTELEMSVTGGGNANAIHVTEARFYAAAWPHALEKTTYAQDAKGFAEQRIGTPSPDGMHITRTIDGKPEPDRVVAGTQETLVEALRVEPNGFDGFTIGAPVEAVTWDWDKESDEHVVVTLKEIVDGMRAGVKERIGVFDILYKSTGVDATTRITAAGDVLSLALGAALEMRLEDQAVALSHEEGLDVMGSGIASPTKLGDPTTADHLQLDLAVTGGFTLPSSTAQTVTTDASGVHVSRTREPGDAVTDADKKAALGSDATMDTNAPTIRAEAEALTKDVSGDDAKVKAVAGWVYQTLEKKLATHLPTASKILAEKVGDCTEHTWLTTALLRAAGIPARPVYGVAYAGDGIQSFAYHAWVEVDLDGHWVWIDPTWNEPMADATHIALGNDLAQVAPSLGAITVKSAKR